MLKNILLPLIGILVALIFIVPVYNASAHGHTSFRINNKTYSFIIGSVGEPIAVDDKTGVDVRVSDFAGDPITGIENTLQVELQAGGKSKILDLSTVFNTPGAYRAVFIPTVQTTYNYRLFGTIDNTPFDYTWSCHPAGHPRAEEDTSEVEISEGVVKTGQSGTFGCPSARGELGFPESSSSIYELNQTNSELFEDMQLATSNALLGLYAGIVGIVLGALALLVVILGRKKV